jgi:hypothetical protein
MLSDEWKLARRHFKKNVISLIKTTAHHFFPYFASIFMHFFISPKYYSYSIFFVSYFGLQFRPSLAAIVVDGTHYLYM